MAKLIKAGIVTIVCLITGIYQTKGQTVMNIHQRNGTVLKIPVNTIDSITYTIGNPGVLAQISTVVAGNITSTTARSGGNVTDSGGTRVTQRGVVWSTSPNPTTANSLTSDGSGTGTFASNLTGLKASTTYYVRAYAINSAGTAYGNQLSFTTPAAGGIVSNPGAGVTFDGYTYPTVVLGNGQEWMAENLRADNYANGDPIANVTGDVDWMNLTTGAWVNYSNNASFENPYGKLYNWYAINDSRKVCPAGWHVPARREWDTLVTYLGHEGIAGGDMKAKGTQYWTSPNDGATNLSGFSGLPGGGRSNDGFFSTINNFGYYWSATSANSTQAWAGSLAYNSTSFLLFGDHKGNGYSVRCVKD